MPSIDEKVRVEGNVEKVGDKLIFVADRVAGPVLVRLGDRIPPHIDVVDSRFWFPQAEWVGRLGLRQFLQGQHSDVWEFVPQYHRKSAAEEKQRRS